MTTIVPMQHILNSTENVDRLKGHVGKALEHYNNINVYHFPYLASFSFCFY